MKGKVSAYYSMPNLGRVRSRLEAPSKELTAQFREIAQSAITEVLNENLLAIRGKFIAKVSQMVENKEIKFKTDKFQADVMSPAKNYFDAIFANSSAELREKCGEETKDESEPEVEPDPEGEPETKEQPAETKEAPAKAKKPAKKAAKGDDDDFSE